MSSIFFCFGNIITSCRTYSIIFRKMLQCFHRFLSGEMPFRHSLVSKIGKLRLRMNKFPAIFRCGTPHLLTHHFAQIFWIGKSTAEGNLADRKSGTVQKPNRMLKT